MGGRGGIEPRMDADGEGSISGEIVERGGFIRGLTRIWRGLGGGMGVSDCWRLSGESGW